MKSPNAQKPHLIVTVGIPGAGKSTFAEHFAETFKAPMISFDLLHEKIFGTVEHHNDQNMIMDTLVETILDEVFKTGRTIVYDGPSGRRSERSNISRKARDAGYEPLFVWIQTETHAAKKRAIKKVRNKSTLSSEQFDRQLKQFSAPHLNERAIVISGKHTYPSQLKIVLKNLVQPRIQPIEQTKPQTIKRLWER